MIADATPTFTRLELTIPQSEMLGHFAAKCGPTEAQGPRPLRRMRYRYFLPDEFYEAVMARLVAPGYRWLDVGGGGSVFPDNPKLAAELAARAELLVGLDPSDNIRENRTVHQQVQARLEDYTGTAPFDIVSLRMVAEHITDPTLACRRLADLLKPGGRVVIFTPNKWSPISVLSRLLPFKLHHPLKRAVWGARERDTFPVHYRMNTRRRLRSLFAAVGLAEVGFRRCDDLSAFHQFRLLNHAELLLWKFYYTLGLPYLEHCLLGVYEKPK